MLAGYRFLFCVGYCHQKCFQSASHWKFMGLQMNSYGGYYKYNIIWLAGSDLSTQILFIFSVRGPRTCTKLLTFSYACVSWIIALLLWCLSDWLKTNLAARKRWWIGLLEILNNLEKWSTCTVISQLPPRPAEKWWFDHYNWSHKNHQASQSVMTIALCMDKI